MTEWGHRNNWHAQQAEKSEAQPEKKKFLGWLSCYKVPETAPLLTGNEPNPSKRSSKKFRASVGIHHDWQAYSKFFGSTCCRFCKAPLDKHQTVCQEPVCQARVICEIQDRYKK